MWNDDLDQVPTGLPLFVVAHEFIDALPVFKFEVCDIFVFIY